MTLNQRALALSRAEQNKLFEVLTANIDIMLKVMPEITLLNLIKSQNFDAYHQDELVQAYLVWRDGK